MRNDDRVLIRRVWIILCAGGLMNLASCSGSNFPKLYPVSGKVTWEDGQPLTAGAVAFHPDSSKGNSAPVDCVSLIDSQGRFELKTHGVRGADSGRGAPLGWYKVILVANPRSARLPEINVNPRYLKPETTPLVVEVKDNPEPGVYDFKLTK